MLRNYLLLSLKVLARNKFYTCVSLFGISVTLMVLMLVTSLVDSFMYPRGPEQNSGRFLVAAQISIGQTPARGGRRVGSIGALGYRFIDRGVLNMQTPELIGVFSGAINRAETATTSVAFSNGARTELVTKRTDANYWKILQFDFLEGRPLTQQEHEKGSSVAVISAATRARLFGGDTAVGKSITLNHKAYEVVGVVRNVSPLEALASADIWLPIFATTSTQFVDEDVGEFIVLLQARSPDDLPLIQKEYELAVRNFQPSSKYIVLPDQPLEIDSSAISRLDLYIRLIRPPQDGAGDPNAGARLLVLLGAGMGLFMLLPALCLININTSRILDRASEIGVRKSFGASAGHLMRQFIVENLVVTAIGGVLGFLLAILALALLDASGLLRGEGFGFNYRVFGLGVLYTVVFGVLSAAGPANKMSRLDPVHALKGAAT